ncbi:cellulose binding domain-containing protein [Glycomyces paridis]|uniref:CBM2 domain-containing protein n=1 Tax=Glycomyces paridis TaxID=2126555 RepID=A0A4S8PAN3_9ACTN|nr:cellulose binding domain-containing protein [Glycomyces paridis]THV27327.1 hypothetical protein E9998_15865 [Glycomyces paridis]
MGRHHASAGSGRLHGRLLQILGAVSAVVALLALWQFGVFGGDGDRDPVSTVEGPETAWFSAEEEHSKAAGPAPSAVSAPVSPTESTQEPTSAAPSESTSSPDAPASSTNAEVELAEVACEATLTLKNEWSSGVEVSVEVVNTGSVEFESWAIDLDIDDLDIGDDRAWNMEDLRHGWYGSTGSNGRLDPGENAIAGFVGETDRGFDLPSSATCVAEV